MDSWDITIFGREKDPLPTNYGVPCVKCGTRLDPVSVRGGDCKAKCPNCGHLYPHGDCSD